MTGGCLFLVGWLYWDHRGALNAILIILAFLIVGLLKPPVGIGRVLRRIRRK
jgi:hypothetical protein